MDWILENNDWANICLSCRFLKQRLDKKHICSCKESPFFELEVNIRQKKCRNWRYAF